MLHRFNIEELLNNYDLMVAHYRPLLLCLFVGMFFSACIVPPRKLKPSILPESELILLSHIKKGQDFAESGKYPLAEREFLAALKLNADLPDVYNDLGYTLHAQNQTEQAIKAFQKSLKYDEAALTPRENLARAYFQTGKYQQALKEFEQVLYWDAQIRAGKVRALSADQERTVLLPPQLAQVHHNISLIYQRLGQADNAVVHAEKATRFDSNPYYIASYVRLLLSLNRVETAHKKVSEYHTTNRGNLPYQLLLDYGITCYLSGEKSASRTSFEKVLALTTTDPFSRNVARLGYYLTASDRARFTSLDSDREALAEDEQLICEENFLQGQDYFPVKFVQDLTTAIPHFCENGRSKS